MKRHILDEDVANSGMLIQPKSTLSKLVNQYYETISTLLDRQVRLSTVMDANLYLYPADA